MRDSFWSVLLICLSFTACSFAQRAQPGGPTTPMGSPMTMRLCIDLCATLTWNGERYLAVRDGESAPWAWYTIERWTPDEFQMNGSSLEENQDGVFITGVFTGKISPVGGNVVDPIVNWQVGNARGSRDYQLTWSVTPSSQPEVTAKTNHKKVQDVSPSEISSFPSRLQDCEDRVCNDKITGLWIFHGNKGTTLWSYAFGRLTVEQFDGTNVVISRIDPPESASAGLTGVYKGILSGGRFDGTFTYTWPGHANNKPVTVPWYATIQPVPEDPQIAGWDFNCEPIPGHPEAIGNPLAAARTVSDQNNLEQAFCWVQTSAILYSDPRAFKTLALMYSRGVGVKQDLVEAARWSESAAAVGDPLPQELRDKLASDAIKSGQIHLTKEGVAQAFSMMGPVLSILTAEPKYHEETTCGYGAEVCYTRKVPNQ